MGGAVHHCRRAARPTDAGAVPGARPDECGRGQYPGRSAITVPWQTLFLSVVLYIVVPVIAAQLWRRSLLARGDEARLAAMLRRLQPVSLVALLATLVLLFGFQPTVILLLAVPIVIQ